MQFSSTFIRISGPVPEVKKSALINDHENIVAYSDSPRNSCLFLLSFKFRNSIPSMQTHTKLLYKYKYIFFLKTGLFNLKSVPLSFSYNNLEVQPRLLLKKIHLFSESRKTEKCSQSNIQKCKNLVVKWEKLGSTA